MSRDDHATRRIRLGMVGGGDGSFIGAGQRGRQPHPGWPPGRPSGGHLEAFAELYRGFARAWGGGESTAMPGLLDGLDGMAFIEAVLASHRQNARWVRLDQP